MSTPSSLIGKQIDQFRLEKFIAKGAMGMLFKAYDTILIRTVAIKLISKLEDPYLSEEEKIGREEARKRLIQEAMAAGRLTHPNIVTIHSYGETEEFKYICMEFISGRTLANVLNEKKILALGEALPLFEQILSALEVANRERIVHRDIKPSNIMITDEGRIKVMDFGIAKLPSLSITVNGTALGTPNYMSPEQISGQKVDIRSDLFSFGTVMYEALTGEKPFRGDNTATLAYQIVQADPTPPRVLNADLPERMGYIIKKAMEKDPRLRYQTPREMLDDLREISLKKSKSMVLNGDETLVSIAVKETAHDRQIPTPVQIESIEAPPPAPALAEKEAAPKERQGDVSTVPQAAEGESGRKDEIEILPIPSSETPPPPQPISSPSPKRGLSILKLGVAGLLCCIAFLIIFKFYMKHEISKPGHSSMENPIPPPPKESSQPQIDSSTVKEKSATSTEIKTPTQTQPLTETISSNPAAPETDGSAASKTGEQPKPAPTSNKPILAGLQIESDPPGATVLMDGHPVGTTRLELTEIEPGKKKIEVQKNCFDSWGNDVDLKPGSKTKLFAQMKAKCGTVRVSSDPAQAEVWLSGKKIGETPLSVDQIEIGKYPVILKHEGFEDWHGNILVKALQTVEVKTVKLKSLPSTSPDIQAVSNETSISSPPSSVGESATVDANAPSTGLQEQNLAKGAQPIIEKPPEYHLTVEAVPVDAKVRIRRIKAVYEPGIKLSPGKYQIEVSRDGYELISQWVEIRDKDLTVPVVLNQIKSNMPKAGPLKITSKPSAASVYLDGKPLGNTPLEMNDIVSGTHSIRISLDGYYEMDDSLDLEPGKVAQIDIELSPIDSQAHQSP